MPTLYLLQWRSIYRILRYFRLHDARSVTIASGLIDRDDMDGGRRVQKFLDALEDKLGIDARRRNGEFPAAAAAAAILA
jgi:hypothetical protein